MKNIEYISAGAGSGKTYTITDILSTLITNGAKPQEMVLATFTDLAAAELREKSRAVLCEKGKYDESVMLDQAMIGTIHSVAYSFICKYWYYLGINARLSVMPEEDTNFYINQSLADLATSDDIRAFSKFRDAFDIQCPSGYGFGTKEDYDFWKSHVSRIIDLALANGISDFTQSCAESKAQARKILDTDDSISFQLDSARCHQLIIRMQQSAQALEGDSGAAEDRKAFLQSQSTVKEFTYADIQNIVKKKWPAKIYGGVQSEINGLTAQCANYWKSKEVGDLMSDFIDRAFSLAAKFLTQYSEYKRAKSIIDYNDMEQLFLRLLTEHTEICDEISGRYKYVFVDEFQDCNPVQVMIFDKLSDLVEKTYWVGDAKQAIYGFRGTDSQLTRTVATKVSAKFGHTREPLSTSYRSLPDIVNTVNKFFTNVFVDKFHMLDCADEVKLSTHRETAGDTPQLTDWLVKTDTGDSDATMPVAQKIAQQIAEGKKPSDIAILCRSNADCDNYADSLNSYGIPVSRGGDSALSNQKETSLLTSILSLIVDNHDDLAKAQILFLTRKDTFVSTLLDDRLTYLGTTSGDDDRQPWQESDPLLSRIIADSKSLARLSVSALVETVRVRYDLDGIISRWDDVVRRKANLESLASLACQYEQHCLNLTLGASITGFLDYVASTDMSVAGDASGVFVNTYHKSKGLEWDTVILDSLDRMVDNDNAIIRKNYFGERAVSDANDSDRLIPAKHITLFPYLWGKSNAPADVSDYIKQQPDYGEVKGSYMLEEARLMYVGMTRARNQLIFISKENQSSSRGTSKFTWFRDISTASINVPASDDTSCDILGTGIPFRVEVLDAPADNTASVDDTEPTSCPVVSIPRSATRSSADLRYQSPSMMSKTTTAIHELPYTQPRIPLHGADDIQRVGDCIHNIFCTLRPDQTESNQSKADRLIHAYGLPLQSADILSAYTTFAAKMKELYGAATAVHHELEFSYPSDGSIVRGSMDLVYDTPEGSVLVDYKTNPEGRRAVSDENDEHYAGRYNTQFTCYVEALRRSGHNVRAKLVYYPVSGILVQLE